MSEYSGSALYAQWVYSGGTVTVSGQHKTFSWNPSKNLIDATAGSDQAQHQIVGVENATASLSWVAQSGGTAVVAALAHGNYGTLTVGPEGTAAGRLKYILPAMSLGAQLSAPYDNVVEHTVEFQQDGGTYTEGNW